MPLDERTLPPKDKQYNGAGTGTQLQTKKNLLANSNKNTLS